MGLLSFSTLSGISIKDTLLIEAACALTVHEIYKRHERDATHVIWHLSLLTGVPSLLSLLYMHELSTSTAILLSLSVFYLALSISIIFYRLSPWHPLACYPGPAVAKISKLWGAVIMAKGKNHEYFKHLHGKYGPYVRIGPNEISVIDVSAFPNILGSNGMPKGPMWSARNSQEKTPSLIALRNKEEHSRRRRPWNLAFNTTSVKGYEPIIEKRALQLVYELEKQSVSKELFHSSDFVGEVNLAQWLSYFTTDFMGDMAFGGGFELMRDGGDKEGIWSIFESGMVFLSFFQHLPWLVALFRELGIARKQLTRFRDFARERVRSRKLNGSTSKDLFYHLMDEAGVQRRRPSESEIISEGGLAIIAGSDTTSTVLSGLFYYLLRNPDVYSRLQKEVDLFFPLGDSDPFNSTKLAEMPLLNAVINETMRLQPPVPSYLQRAPEKGSGGQWINNRSFIPEGTSVVIPPYVVMRSSEYFSPEPEKFWPERWLQSGSEEPVSVKQDNDPTEKYGQGRSVSEKSGVVTNTTAFIPFSYGPANCAGRLLAIVEMRMVVALLMQRFEMRFSGGYDPIQWERDLLDYFVLSNGPLPVVLTSRS